MTHSPVVQPVSVGANRVLVGLPREEYSDIVRCLEPVALTRGMVLQRQEEIGDYVYFPGGGACSLTHSMGDGQTIIIATVGREGIVAPSLLSGGVSALGAVVHVPSDMGWRMRLDAFRKEMGRRGRFFDLVTHYTEALVGSIIRTAACNRLHSVEERLPRWLLLTRDRLGANEIPLTHDTLALMLGVRRASVTLAAGSLHVAGLIECRRGRISIVNPQALEAVACECYGNERRLPERPLRNPAPADSEQARRVDAETWSASS